MEKLDYYETTYSGRYLIRYGTFYWIPNVINPYNAYETASVKGIREFGRALIEAHGETEEEIFAALGLYDDQVILSMEKVG